MEERHSHLRFDLVVFSLFSGFVTGMAWSSLVWFTLKHDIGLVITWISANIGIVQNPIINLRTSLGISEREHEMVASSRDLSLCPPSSFDDCCVCVLASTRTSRKEENINPRRRAARNGDRES
ncbi:hypothetical protein BLNAU_6923 [Blattamonas nauphoetae]|uniref:Uncharacterized protein n=1 Tax=Blattamonas nauphoetae TaxID=2049346 RepID=A0ABQ9Y2M2_9EUKA|nr:hypothetical protein BLNAU_6923 [Blattamonas nauphoetae]